MMDLIDWKHELHEDDNDHFQGITGPVSLLLNELRNMVTTWMINSI